MPVDILNQFQALTTKTASANGTAIDSVNGTPRRGAKARIIYSVGTITSGNTTVTWTVDASSDNTTFQTIATGPEGGGVVLTSAATASGETFVPFETTLRYQRVSIVVTGTGTGSSMVYQADWDAARPG